MLIDEIITWDRRARAQWTYISDPADKDIWRSHADDVLANRPWGDDCDGLAETVLDLCCRAGLARACAYRLVVKASSDGSGHMVGCVIDVVGRMWIVGDTFVPNPYPAEAMRHRADIYNRLSEQAWRGGAPWQLVPNHTGEPFGTN